MCRTPTIKWRSNPAMPEVTLPHVRKMRVRLQEARDHLREDIGRVDEALCQRLFGDAALALDRLILAFDLYEHHHDKTRRQS